MNQLIGNRVAERDIRDWLNEHGYIGNSAQIEGLELQAISRPGWIQVFRFTASVKPRVDGGDPEGDDLKSAGETKAGDSKTPPARIEYFGVIRDDERRRSGPKAEVELFSNAEQQQARLDDWSEGLIVRSSEHSLAMFWFVIVVLLGFVLVAALVSFLT